MVLFVVLNLAVVPVALVLAPRLSTVAAAAILFLSLISSVSVIKAAYTAPVLGTTLFDITPTLSTTVLVLVLTSRLSCCHYDGRRNADTNQHGNHDDLRSLRASMPTPRHCVPCRHGWAPHNQLLS